MRHNRWNRVFMILLLAVLLAVPYLLTAATRDVPSVAYPTIQAGINAAVPGDTVSVADGTYSEKVVVGQSGIVVQGAGPGRTFMNLSTTGGTAFTFENITGTTLKWFTIRKADTGVKASKSKPNVENNIFLKNVNAFNNHSSYSRIINNTFYSNARAVFSNSSSTLTNNIISGSSRYGVTGSKAGSITYNLFHGNTLGNYSGISDPLTNPANISGDPLFVSTPSDFHLKTGSPARDAGDTSVTDAIDNFATQSDIGVYGGPGAYVTPATVTGVMAASYTDKVSLSWNKNLAYNVTGYKVYYGTTSGSYSSSVYVGDVNSADIVNPPLTLETRYYFSVRADDGIREGLDSTEVFGAIDNTAPSVPGGLSAGIGNRRLYLSWGAAADSGSGVEGYKVYYGTTSGTYPNTINVGNVTSYELTGLTNGVTYYIAVSAYDNVVDVPNESAVSAEVSETPEEVEGIAGLKNTGGCFIATAAYGSYEERHVKILREFRDRYLISNFKFQISNSRIEIPNIAGRAFVSIYYRMSPPVADFIRDSEVLKALVRVALLPLIAAAWFLVNHPILTSGCIVLITIWAMRFKHVGAGSTPVHNGQPQGVLLHKRLMSYVLFFTLLLLLPTASFGSENDFTVGLTYGRLEPVSDEWKDIYGSDGISNYRISLGYMFMPAIGAEVGMGYLTENGKGKTVTGRQTGVKTTFQEVPVDFTLIYRMNYFPEKAVIPYIGGGMSYNLYWENVKDGRKLKGGMWGHHVTAGLQLLIDGLDIKSAHNLEEEYGIDNTYLTIGATHSVINDLGKEEVDLGGWNYNIGLMFEF